MIILKFCRDFLLRTGISVGIILLAALFVFIGAMLGGEIGVFAGAVIFVACFIMTVLDDLL